MNLHHFSAQAAFRRSQPDRWSRRDFLKTASAATLSALAGTGPEDLNIAHLIARVEAGDVREVILALGATVDGATTTHYLTDRLKPLGITVTRVAQGMPMGGALDVLDDGTLGAALRARRSV